MILHTAEDGFRMNNVIPCITKMDERVPSRPMDRTFGAGPPASPPEFPGLFLKPGRRDNVVVYCEKRKIHIIAKNVLFRDYSRDCYGCEDTAISKVQTAYWPVPNKKTKQTIMGKVEICHVLKASRSFPANDGDSDEDSLSSTDEDPEIIFTLTNQFVAVKVNYGSQMNRLLGLHCENPIKEISAMQLIGNENPHVMEILEYLVVDDNLVMVMPYAASGDLFDMMENRGMVGLPEGEARFWFRQLLDGVKHLHKKGICHRDLSLENTMIHENNLMIIDMGMAVRIPFNDRYGTEKRLIQPQGACGKLSYMSPEIYQNLVFDGPAVDIWSAGAILFCLLTAKPAYEKPPISNTEFAKLHQDISQLPISSECIDLLQGLLQGDYRLRYTMEEIINHPWFAQQDVAPEIREVA